ncbi:hypothetical protein SAMN05428945_6584 [Streptomyces sp. 2224.1]|uniref:hypothetical protein n=1 Tax=unclassified Streptomyces TaxID=2593676 RepID=UPI00089CC2F6|nr:MULTISPECIES: hypothetical protein [unclassified Streptomyces]PBC85944.1 hypothetical protein BX261_5985 [Streptomyces sp. 2321.6]SED83674.1 hypothetical protein SAMN05428940_6010 [Streptomyces sp. 2133.1]SEE15739.1 hypothetical protein SAMN05428945_6584 [Streptomyces sp. 2224.1]SNC72825.1 hypothetical protein SAMN06272741_5911 [Streptomyces sp. 2114.4]
MGFRRRVADLWQPWHTGHALVAIPLGLIVAISVVDVLVPGDIHLGPLLIVAPAITPWLAGPWLTGLVGVLAVAARRSSLSCATRASCSQRTTRYR